VEEEHGRDRMVVVLVESQAWLRRLPYHRKRQVLILSAGRHHAEELGRRGYAVDRIAADDAHDGLSRLLKAHRPAGLVMMESSEHAIRKWQRGKLADQAGVPLTLLPNTQFLVGRFDPIPEPKPGHRYVMENFYRAMRRRFGVLMEPSGQPVGGRWNFDRENRKPLPKGLVPPPLPSFPPDAITREVIEQVDAAGHGVGTTAGFDLAVTRADAEAAFADFVERRLPLFGPYEDAMSAEHATLFHSVLSPQMNLGLLEPLAMVKAVEAAYAEGRAPLNSAEGFIRQVLGWREFIYWQYHRQMPGLRSANGWSAHRPMPAFFWDAQTDMACLRTVVERLLDTGFTHHIERLMVVCNFCLLAGIDPAAVADWFLTFYIDSHDWVVLPNVIGMGLNADGGLTATKPYVASAAYINKMSDYCATCRFNPKVRTGADACPFNFLYWNFLLSHEAALRSNPRLGPAVLGLRYLDEAERSRVKAGSVSFLESLQPYQPAP
jgi:deoxyribodipyrimidine photolyase-related protein